MLVKFDEITDYKKLGNKGKNLILLKENGFNVPDGFVLDTDIYDQIINEIGKKSEIENLINCLDSGNVEEISNEILSLFDDVEIPQSLSSLLHENLRSDIKYAVRSSGLKEDLEAFSFAGQYKSFLNVFGEIDIANAVIECYKSMFSVTILSYLVDNEISADDLKMAVVIQEMVASDYSGIAFTIDPIGGDDKTILVETAMGLGEDLVSGRVKAEQHYYNWFENKYDYSSENKIVSEGMLQFMMEEFLKIQTFFGFPCDIEFAVENCELFILQARAITKIKYGKIKDIWTTADFKDGGVSAYVCTPFMWSLYEYVWEYSMKKFVLDSRILSEKDVQKKVGEMFYGRPYWNLSTVKKAMSSVPGYTERQFDSEFGIKITYEGDGEKTGINPLSIAKILRIALAQKKILTQRKNNAENYKEQLLDEYFRLKNSLNNEISDKDFCDKWYKLTKYTYLNSETTYFWQIFINTIHQSLYKDGLLKFVDESEYLCLLSGIDNISHLLPFYEMWGITRKIRKNEEAFKFWSENSPERIVKELENENYFTNNVINFIEKYGYHSDRELDVTVPCYFEDKIAVVKMFCENVLLEDKYSPIDDKNRQSRNFNKQLEKIKAEVSARKFKKIKRKIDGMREMLWWREEFRDISTRFYCMIRSYTLKLAEILISKQVISEIDDIWMLKIEDLWGYFDGDLTAKELRNIISRNKKYYNSFRNFTSENEIGHVFDLESKSITAKKDGIFGLGCNNGVVTATARVVSGLEEIDKLRKGDILITKYTDTGWTCKFAMLSGIVTEYGGILCHSAIISREYGIPCIVCATDVMKKVKDGSIITINGGSGEVIINKNEV